MNEFQGIESGSGLLKNAYEQSADPLEISLKKRREKLMEGKGMKDPESVEAPLPK